MSLVLNSNLLIFEISWASVPTIPVLTSMRPSSEVIRREARS